MSAAPLAGLLVVDLSRLLPGPLTVRLLADLGARVIKVEEPALGDPIRRAPPRRGGTGALAARRRRERRPRPQGAVRAHGPGGTAGPGGRARRELPPGDSGPLRLPTRASPRAAERRDLIRRQFSTSRGARRKVEQLIRRRTRAEWLALLEREDIPAEMVLSAAEARGHPQMKARGVLSDGPDALPRLAFPARLDGERPRAAQARVPGHGEHTVAVLEELGLRDCQVSYGVGRRFSWRGLLARLWPF